MSHRADLTKELGSLQKEAAKKSLSQIKRASIAQQIGIIETELQFW